jgi:hypothetical protein
MPESAGSTILQAKPLWLATLLAFSQLVQNEIGALSDVAAAEDALAVVLPVFRAGTIARALD